MTLEFEPMMTRSEVSMDAGIDRIDRKILMALQRDGRISNLRLAESVALSPTAVLARVQRLTRDGYILGYEARLNPLMLGAGMMVFVEVLLDRTSPMCSTSSRPPCKSGPRSWNATWSRAASITFSRPAVPT